MSGPDARPVCRRGEVWMLDWNPGRGSEQLGHRPGVIVQCDEGNLTPGARTTILVPLTTQGRPFTFYVPLPAGPGTGLRQPSWANCTQIITVDRSRLRTRLGVAPEAAMAALAEAIAGTLAIPVRR